MTLLERVFKHIKKRELPEPFANRLPDLQQWQDSFGDAFGVADRVLTMFCDAFMFDGEERYKFVPDDTVIAVYRAVYPSRWTPDALEHPILIDALEKEFSFRFEPTRLEKIGSFRQIGWGDSTGC